jgi:Secretion system C-terminal sorting domain/Putative metal-binding motif
MQTFYRDVDSDGYGNASDSLHSCYQPIGYVLNKTDCNDKNATLHPGATEIVDHIGNDCDGIIDETAIAAVISSVSSSAIESAKSITPSNKLSLYPNPSPGNLTITYNCDNAGKIQLRIYDIHGRILFNKTENAVKGINTFHPDLFNFDSGTYFFELNNNDIRNMSKFLIAK